MGTILLKAATAPNAVPLPAELEVRELGIDPSNGRLYTKLSNGSIFHVNGAATVTLQDLGGAPLEHEHLMTDVAGLDTSLSSLQTQIDGKAALAHSHAIANITGLQTALDGKAASSHTHAIGDVTNLQTALDGKAASSHTHAIADVTGLQTALDGKSSTSHTHTPASLGAVSKSGDTMTGALTLPSAGLNVGTLVYGAADALRLGQSTTSTPHTSASTGGGAIAADYISLARIGAPSMYLTRIGSNGGVINFHRDGTQVGSISVTGTSSAFNQTSDYRIKENVNPLPQGLRRLMCLKPVRFTYVREPERAVDGFLAHEVQEVVPEAVTGVKNEIDAAGNPVLQQLDNSKLVPLLVAAVQELTVALATLQAKIDAK